MYTYIYAYIRIPFQCSVTIATKVNIPLALPFQVSLVLPFH